MIYRPDDTGPLELGAHEDELAALPSLIANIVETMRFGNVAELEVVRGDFRLALRAFPRGSEPTNVGVAIAGDESEDDLASDGANANIYVVTAPMIGTFYVAPAPGEPPFVQPGDEVEAGQAVCIIEAMKIMNEIAAERGGTVLEVLVEDGQTVEYGSPLVRIQLDA